MQAYAPSLGDVAIVTIPARSIACPRIINVPDQLAPAAPEITTGPDRLTGRILRVELEGVRGATSAIVVPIKSFALAKNRLSGHLAGERRHALARDLAAHVLSTAAPHGVVVVCNDDDVASWATRHRAGVIVIDQPGLNLALTLARTALRTVNVERMVICHSDLPFIADFAPYVTATGDDVVVAPDRHGSGTNIMSLPVSSSFPLQFGAGSLAAHRDVVQSTGSTFITIDDPSAAWDIDEPSDLEHPELQSFLDGGDNDERTHAVD